MEKNSIQSAKTRPGADCGSDHECLTAKFRLKLKKVGKTTRSFKYDLNQIPNNHTVQLFCSMPLNLNLSDTSSHGKLLKSEGDPLTPQLQSYDGLDVLHTQRKFRPLTTSPRGLGAVAACLPHHSLSALSSRHSDLHPQTHLPPLASPPQTPYPALLLFTRC